MSHRDALLVLPHHSEYRNLANRRFATIKMLVPQCLDSYKLITIRRFFQKTWRYLDAYQKELNMQQAALANKKYKSHWKVPLSKDIKDSIDKHGVKL
jgi:hypothetical protein